MVVMRMITRWAIAVGELPAHGTMIIDITTPNTLHTISSVNSPGATFTVGKSRH